MSNRGALTQSEVMRLLEECKIKEHKVDCLADCISITDPDGNPSLSPYVMAPNLYGADKTSPFPNVMHVMPTDVSPALAALKSELTSTRFELDSLRALFETFKQEAKAEIEALSDQIKSFGRYGKDALF